MDGDVDPDAEQDEDEDEDMPEFFKDAANTNGQDTKTPSRNPKSKAAIVVRAKINKVLAETELADKRSRQCDQNDFLRLLLGRFFAISKMGLRLTGTSVPQGGHSFLLSSLEEQASRGGIISWRFGVGGSCEGHDLVGLQCMSRRQDVPFPWGIEFLRNAMETLGSPDHITPMVLLDLAS